MLGLIDESMNLLQPRYHTNCAKTSANSNDCSMIGDSRRTIVAMVTQPSLIGSRLSINDVAILQHASQPRSLTSLAIFGKL